MQYFDPHIHMASRTTDDLEAMAAAGCVAVGEPSFWPGFDRSGMNSFRDYFRQLTEWEPKRARQLRHPPLLLDGHEHQGGRGRGLLPRNDRRVARVSRASDRAGRGRDRPAQVHANEVTTLLDRWTWPCKREEQMLFHTPHLEDKYKGTRMILDMLRADRRVDPGRVCIDHCEEHTIRLALRPGLLGRHDALSTTKATPERAVDMIEIYGPERILVNSSADWGPSDPLAVPAIHGRDASPRPLAGAGEAVGVR